MRNFNELAKIKLILIEADVKRKIVEYSEKLGIGFDIRFRFKKESGIGHIIISVYFLDAEQLGKTISSENIDKKSEAEINLNYHVELPNGILYKDINDRLLWQYVYPQIKVDVVLYSNSISLPPFVIPYELESEIENDAD